MTCFATMFVAALPWMRLVAQRPAAVGLLSPETERSMLLWARRISGLAAPGFGAPITGVQSKRVSDEPWMRVVGAAFLTLVIHDKPGGCLGRLARGAADEFMVLGAS